MTARRESILAGLAIVALTCAAYLPAMRAGFTWDDDDYVIKNPELRDPAGLGRIWTRPSPTTHQYYPLVYTTFWLEYQLWGLNPFGYHVVNILLHAAAAVLLWRVLVLLGLRGAWLAAAIFALHPVCVESVAWVTERKNVLSAAFYFATGLCYLRFCRLAEAPGQTTSRRWGLYVLVVVLYACALLSKTVTATLPAALLLVVWWKRGKPSLRELATLIPLLLAGAMMGIATALIERAYVGAEGMDWHLTALERFLLAGRALWFYAGKLALPLKLTFIYPRWDVSDAVWWQYLYSLAAILVLWALWVGRRRIGKGPLVGALLFAGTLFPALGFANVYFFRFSFVADHFQYLATPGLIVLFTSTAAWIVQRHRSLWPGAKLAGALLLGVLATLTWSQAGTYRNPVTHWRDTLAKNPNAWLGMVNLGILVGNQGHVREALDLFERCVAIKPDLPSAHLNRGEAYRSFGRLEEAIEDFTEAIRLKPRYPEAYVQRGQTWARLGRPARAFSDYDAAIKLDGNSARAFSSRGVAYARAGQIEKAIDDFARAIKLDPNSAEMYRNRGLAYARKGAFARAVSDYDKAIELRPDYAEAWYGRGIAYGRLGELGRAATSFSKAIEQDPRYINAYRNRALLFWQTGRPENAVSDCQKALYLAMEAGRADLAKALREQLALYRSGKPSAD